MNSSVVSRFEYGYTPAGRRDWARQSGTAFEIAGVATTYDFGYNPRGELTSASGYLANDGTDPSKKLPNLQHEYAYDNIGNRLSANQTGAPAKAEAFVPDVKNQIVSRENKTVIASGTVGDGAAVAVSFAGGAAVPASRQGRYWSAALAPNNAQGPVTGSMNVWAAQGGAVRAETTTAVAGKAAQTLTYDFDGNLIADGIWEYHWDAENRLVHAATSPAARAVGFAAIDVWHTYDYLGRRIATRKLEGSVDTHTRYLYDGWNLIAQYAAPGGTSIGSLEKTFTWGLDLSGSLSGAGGAGGLLRVSDHAAASKYYPAYDGNGNVVALIDASDGSTDAIYEYSPFGELLRAEGAYAKENPFRFSTKFTDDETGLVYFGFRHYSPSLGRFINRDPIGEAGGANLYGYVGNDPVGNWDYLGLCYNIYYGSYYGDGYGFGFGFGFGGDCWYDDFYWGGGGGGYSPPPTASPNREALRREGLSALRNRGYGRRQSVFAVGFNEGSMGIENVFRGTAANSDPDIPTVYFSPTSMSPIFVYSDPIRQQIFAIDSARVAVAFIALPGELINALGKELGLSPDEITLLAALSMQPEAMVAQEALLARLSGMLARVGISVEARAELVRLLRLRERQLELGKDAARGGQFNAAQGAGGVRIEQYLGREIKAGTHPGVDFVDSTLGNISLKGPIPGQGSVEGLARSVIADATSNTATQTIFVDATGLSAEQFAQLQSLINAGVQGTTKRVYIMRQ